MKKVNLRQVKENAIDYVRDTAVALDARLQQAVVVGAISTATAVVVSLFFTPVVASWISAGFFWFLGEVAVGALALVSTPVGLAIDGMVLVGMGVLWAMTKGLEAGAEAWHKLAFGLALAGAANLVVVGVPILLIALNVAVWVVMVVAVLFLCLLVLGAMAS
jgi:hypothetical protein